MLSLSFPALLLETTPLLRVEGDAFLLNLDKLSFDVSKTTFEVRFT